MSGKGKGSGKDKKKGEESELQKMVEEQKRQILEQSFTIKKLQDRLSRMTEQNYEIVSTKDKFHADYQEKMDKNRILIQSHESTIKQKSNKIYELQVEKINLKNKINNLQRELKESEAIRVREFEEYKKLTQSQMIKLENQLKEYNYYMSEREKMETENDKLKKTLYEEKETKIRQIADKEREKVQATDKLRDQMLTKIRDMRTNLLSLKKEQLSTTTRLAVLQNHQLTSELEFQSKQSQKLIFENQNLTKKVTNLQKDLEIHKQIQQELAKRSHYSRGIIKKLTSKIGQLEEEIVNLKKSSGKSGTQQERENSPQLKKVEIKDSLGQENDRKDEMIKALDKSLELTEKKYLKLQAELQSLRTQNSSVKTKLQKWEKTAYELTGLLLKYYEEYLSSQTQSNGQDSQIYDLKSMRKNKAQEWSHEQVRLVVLILLNKLASQINKKSLGIPMINKSNLNVEDEDDLIPRVKFPRISQHSAVSKLGSTYINASSSALQIKKLKDLPVNMASKIVASNVREWGRTVHTNSVTQLSRKFKIAQR